MRAEANTVQAERRAKVSGALRIGLLGGFTVSVGERKVDARAWRLRKAANLMKLLALAPGHRLHRERAMDLLWPESSKKAASNNLRQTLHVARKTLYTDPEIASGYLSVSGEQLVLCPLGQLWVDVDAFEEAAATARRSNDPAAYRAAIELYSGELLPEDRYEEWAEDLRQDLRRTFLSLLVELARLHEERGADEDLAQAIQALQRALAEEPTNEEAHVALMRAYALSERQGEALRQYGRLSEALSSGLGVEPSASTHVLREKIVDGRFPAHPTQLPTETVGPPTGESSGGAQAHNLPAQRTSFVGREREMLELKRQLAMTRLLTLSGAGGSGKTRLALEVARDLVGAYPDGVWLVELAPLSEGALVPQAVAKAAKVLEQPGRSLTEAIVDALRQKRMLVVLDNCEHLIEEAAQLVDVLLPSCPHVRVLATSRETLDVEGELLWRVDSLSVPAAPRDGDRDAHRAPAAAGELVRYEAVRLFVERAKFHSPHFELTAENAGAVAHICRHLDGMPLAVELAAARVRTLSVEQIAERLGDTFGLLTGGGRTTVPRQRTLKGALDWSHGLLEKPERVLFRCLSVFAGGWTLEEAEAVVTGKNLEQGDVLKLTSGLVDKSLVVTKASRDARVRYRLLEPVRQYALEKLEESGEAEALRLRHASYFLVLAEEAEPGLWGAEEATWLGCLESEHDNLRAALSWSLEHGRTEATLRFAGALSRFWETRGHVSEGVGWLEEALSKDDQAAPAARAGALLGLGSMLLNHCDFARSEACFQEAIGLYEGLGDRARVAEAMSYLGWNATYRGDAARATALFEEGLAAARESGNRRILPYLLTGLGGSASDAGDFERAGVLWKEALELERQSGSNMGASGVLFNLGYAELAKGNQEPAMALLEESLATAREVGDKGVVAAALLGLGIATTLRGEPDEASTPLKESLTIELELENKGNVAENLEGLAEAAGASRQDLRAARLWGAAEALREEMGVRWGAAERLLHEPQLLAARSRIHQAIWETGFAEGETMGLEHAVDYALLEEESTAASSQAPDQPSIHEQPPTLTAREGEVAAMVARGLSNRQIAQELYLSERTIEHHVSKTLRKLGLASRTEIAAWATQQRLIAPESR